MTGTGDDFLATARTAADLLRDPAVAAAWNSPSALPDFGVSGLAGHLAYQVLAVPQILAGPVPQEPTVSLLEHYDRVSWIGADLDADINVRIRQGGEETATDGPAALAARVDAAVKELEPALTAGLGPTPDRPVRIPFWGPWSLTLDDLLITRMMELAVHSDDLAVSVGLPTPEFPPAAMTTVIDLLSRLAVRRHGGTNVLRALSRAERAPGTISAF
ncbi:maleylpyruvate isomerase N-terminal domain-containing protein [Streptomyces sp. NPDC020681]|uniref:maleylpyruvate isomerase N-terminal domain-containing protein n=1 Tax=Streptomyces sp. NPDC020681 TaxID=3365083 RepID=UPI0037BC8687